eukprot:g7282.t1
MLRRASTGSTGSASDDGEMAAPPALAVVAAPPPPPPPGTASPGSPRSPGGRRKRSASIPAPVRQEITGDGTFVYTAGRGQQALVDSKDLVAGWRSWQARGTAHHAHAMKEERISRRQLVRRMSAAMVRVPPAAAGAAGGGDAGADVPPPPRARSRTDAPLPVHMHGRRSPLAHLIAAPGDAAAAASPARASLAREKRRSLVQRQSFREFLQGAEQLSGARALGPPAMAPPPQPDPAEAAARAAAARAAVAERAGLDASAVHVAGAGAGAADGAVGGAGAGSTSDGGGDGDGEGEGEGEGEGDGDGEDARSAIGEEDAPAGAAAAAAAAAAATAAAAGAPGPGPGPVPAPVPAAPAAAAVPPPPPLGAPGGPQDPNMREEQVEAAVRFLRQVQDKRVAGHDRLTRKVAFLEMKGLAVGEIEAALGRLGYSALEIRAALAELDAEERAHERAEAAAAAGAAAEEAEARVAARAAADAQSEAEAEAEAEAAAAEKARRCEEPGDWFGFFKARPLKAMRLLQDSRSLEPGAKAVAAFLRTTRGLDKAAVGELIGGSPLDDRKLLGGEEEEEEQQQQQQQQEEDAPGPAAKAACPAPPKDKVDEEAACAVCSAYASGFCFADASFIIAFRFFLSRFELPGEAQKISRILNAFAATYHRDNPRGRNALRTCDGVFLLAYSAVMLNVDAHSPNLQGQKRMSRREFERNCRGIDGGADVNSKLLHDVYDSVTKRELLVAVEVPPAISKDEADVVFEAGPLGLELETGFDGEAVVVKRCVPRGQAAALGVKKGNVLVAIHSESIVGLPFEQVMWQLHQAHKPLMLRFRDYDIFFRAQRKRSGKGKGKGGGSRRLSGGSGRKGR